MQNNEMFSSLGNMDDLLPSEPYVAPARQDDEEVELSIAEIGLAHLKEYPNAPTDEDIDNWIDRYGQEGIFLVRLAPGDTYLLRYITQGEHRTILKMGQEARQRIAPDDYDRLEAIDERLKFMIVKNSCLWHPKFPAPLAEETFVDARAGLLNNLVSVININSYFFPDPQQVLNFTGPIR